MRYVTLTIFTMIYLEEENWKFNTNKGNSNVLAPGPIIRPPMAV